MKPETELRELDAWIKEHIFGWQWWRFNYEGQEWCELVSSEDKWPESKKSKWNGSKCLGPILGIEDTSDYRTFSPTTNPADAMAVWGECVVEDKDSIVGTSTWRVGDVYYIKRLNILVKEPTLPLAIAKFARQLFSA